MIYLDHHAATPIVDAARAAMDHARDVGWANPSSPHAAGRAARAILEDARRRVAAAVAVRPSQLVLTAGGSEACQLGIVGLRPFVTRVVTTTIEHPAVERAIASLGVECVRVPVLDVRIGVDAFTPHLGEGVLVATQWVNHEVGSELPIEELALACRAKGASLFVDATQAFGKRPLELAALGAATVALASTKIGGPAGAGALVVELGRAIEPLLVGGGQEHGLRAGTQSVVAHAGFGAAAGVCHERIAAMPSVGRLRDRLERRLEELGAKVNGGGLPRVASCTNVSFVGRRASVFAAALDLEGVAVATGPACSSGVDVPSPTVRAMYPYEPERAASALRFSIGPATRDDEIDAALAAVERVLSRTSPR